MDTDTTSTAAGIGHNRPPGPPEETLEELAARLDTTYAYVVARAEELADAESRLPDSLDDVTVRHVVDHQRQLRTCRQSAIDAHKAAKQPYLDAGRVIDGWKNSIIDRLSSGEKRAAARVDAFMAAKRAVERKAKEEEAKRLAAEAKKLAAEGDKEQAKTVRQAAADVRDEAKEPSTTKVVTATGGTATQTDRWVGEVVDYDALDLDALRQYLPLPELDKAVARFVKKGGRHLRGAKIVKAKKLNVR